MTAPIPTTVDSPPVLPVAPPIQDDGQTPPAEAITASVGTFGFIRIRDERVPSWLVSMIVHTIALLLLALFSVPLSSNGRSTLTVTIDAARQGDAAELEQIALPDPTSTDTAQANESPVEAEIAWDATELTAVESPLEPERLAEPTVADAARQVSDSMSIGEAARMPTGGGLEGRSPEGRLTWGEKLGATPESENAVEMALKWLAAHQRKDGSWTFDLSGPPCDGRCNDGRNNPDRLPAPPTAATGLALLAFLGAGYTHEVGPYTEQVERGLYYLRGQMSPAEFGSDLQRGSMYGHGIATLAVCEAAAMSGDEDLRAMAEELTQFILAARHPSGSWGYTPGTPGDITLTGWQLMALKGAKRLEIPMPTDTFSRIKSYVDSLSADDGVHYGYRKPGEAKTPTAIGLTLQLYLGRSPAAAGQRQGVNQLLAWGPTHQNVYHDYYATLAMHHASDPRWPEWHVPVRDHLIATQEKAGHLRGSWHFKDHFGDVGGRLYTTAMAAMILEVYYRHLPLYDEDTEFPL